MTAHFWLGLAALPVGAALAALTFYAAVKAWDGLTGLVDRIRPRRLPAPRRLYVVGEGRYRLDHRDRAVIAAGIVYDPTAFFIPLLPGVVATISRGYQDGPEQRARATALNRKFLAAVREVDREHPAYAATPSTEAAAT